VVELTHYQNSEGRVSFTSDVWSKTDLSAFMAVTAHYLISKEAKLVLRHQLVAFRHIEGSHTGKHLAEIFFHVLQELAILDRVSHSLWLNTVLTTALCMARSAWSRLTMPPITTP